MADPKNILFRLEIQGTDQQLEKLRALTAEQEKLKSQIKATENVGTSENEKRKLNLKDSKKQTSELTKEIMNQNRATGENIKTLEGMKAKLALMNKELDKLEVGSDKFKKLTEDSKKLRGEINGANEATGRFQGNVGNYENAISSAFQKMGINISGVTGSIRQASEVMTATTTATAGTTKGFNLLKIAIIGTGIGLLVIAIMAVVTAFKSSEEGQNKWNKILGVTGAIVGNFMDLLAALGEKLIWVFENPKKALEDFGNLIKDQIFNRLNGMLELIPAVGKAIKLAFSGKFKEAGKVAADALLKITTGVENVTDKIEGAIEATGEFIKEQAREAKLAAQVSDMRAKADLVERNLLIERSKTEQEISELRLKARQEDEFSAEQRKQALIDAQDLEDNLLAKELESLQLRADAQTMENSFARSTKENLDEEAKLIAAVNNQTTTRLNQQRTTQRELNRINKEIAADNNRTLKEQEAEDKRVSDAKIAEAERVAAAKEKLNEIAEKDLIKYNEFLANLQDELFLSELEKIEQHFDDKMALITGQSEEELLILKEIRARKQAAIDEENKKQADIVKNQAAFEKTQADQTGAAIVEMEKTKKDAQLNLAVGYLNSIAELAGKESALGKATAVAAATISTYQAAQEAYAGMLKAVPGPAGIPLAIAAASLAVLTGLINVKKIVSVKTPKAKKFARGVIGLEGAGTGTSDSINAKLSAGESVMTARATRVFAPMLADMERSVGNTPNFNTSHRRFAGGLIGKPNTAFPTNFDRIIERTIAAVGTIPVVVSENDITGTQERVRQIKVTGDL